MAEMTWHQAIQHVLEEQGGPMHAQDITDQIVELGLRENLGATPRNTVNIYLTTSLRNEGSDSPYVRIDRGVYGLRGQQGGIQPSELSPRSEALSVSEDDFSDAEDVGLVQAFGMYWQRASVHWTATASQLLGRQQIGASSVDFASQLGVYLLHDGREVVYVGRSTERPLGRRLYEHTQDRLKTRWDRFSWFGLLKVTEQGDLIDVPFAPTGALVATTLEAVLVEGLEPRQNRKRGDGFNATEYLQVEDPEIERRRQLALFESLRSKF